RQGRSTRADLPPVDEAMTQLPPPVAAVTSPQETETPRASTAESAGQAHSDSQEPSQDKPVKQSGKAGARKGQPMTSKKAAETAPTAPVAASTAAEAAPAGDQP